MKGENNRGSSKDFSQGLSEKGIPGPDFRLSEIEEFARTFDDYTLKGWRNNFLSGFQRNNERTDWRLVHKKMYGAG